MIFSYFGRFIFGRRRQQIELGEPSIIVVVKYDEVAPKLIYRALLACPIGARTIDNYYKLTTAPVEFQRAVIFNYRPVVNHG